jgi:two-component system, chemotaxis family, sensor kinase CheA
MMGFPLTFDIEADEIEIFLQDVNEHLQTMEAGILRLEQAADLETLNAVFRAAHTLKAVAATVGHQQMAELTHTLETLFDAMREDGLLPTQAVTDELLIAVDVLKELRDEVVSLQSSGVDVTATLDRLRTMMEGAVDDQKPGFLAKTRFLGEASHRLTPGQTTQAQKYYEEGHAILEIDVAVAAECFAPAARLLQAAMALEEVGQIVAQHPAQPDLLEDRQDGNLWLILAAQTDQSAIEECLASVPELSEFRARPYAIAPIYAPQNAVHQEREKTVRISVERLDTLMNLVGELVTDRTRLTQLDETLSAEFGKNGNIGRLGEMVTHFGRVVGQLQGEVMQARMLPIEHLFEKFPRLVRDLARAADKKVNLVIEGAATELDRSVIEIIGDPLIHLLRNAVDHGIEPPEERVAAGKPETGSIWLEAGHEDGQIVITVKGDGRGIEPARIRAAAVERGLLSEEEAARLDDDAAISLIFEPNLSTAAEVTDVSGRGVGLDVVRTNVKRLSGTVVVESEVGAGTTFRLTLPLTLAIVQAMLVALGEDVYAIPLTGIVETLYLSDVTVSSVKGVPVIHWRDSVLPLVYLRRFFSCPGEETGFLETSQQAVVTVAWGKQQIGLVVDGLIGKREIVIKSLSPILGNVPGLSGCTILGDGRIALIIDVPGLVGACLQAQRQERTP